MATLDGLHSPASASVLFWEPLTGQQWAPGLRWDQQRPFAAANMPPDDQEPWPFQALYSLFSPDCLALNLQPRPSLGPGLPEDALCFDLTDTRFWVRFPHPRRRPLSHPGGGLLPPEESSPGPMASPGPLPCLSVETHIERALRRELCDLRAQAGLACTFSEPLCTALQVRSVQIGRKVSYPADLT